MSGATKPGPGKARPEAISRQMFRAIDPFRNGGGYPKASPRASRFESPQPHQEVGASMYGGDGTATSILRWSERSPASVASLSRQRTGAREGSLAVLRPRSCPPRRWRNRASYSRRWSSREEMGRAAGEHRRPQHPAGVLRETGKDPVAREIDPIQRREVLMWPEKPVDSIQIDRAHGRRRSRWSGFQRLWSRTPGSSGPRPCCSVPAPVTAPSGSSVPLVTAIAPVLLDLGSDRACPCPCGLLQ